MGDAAFRLASVPSQPVKNMNDMMMPRLKRSRSTSPAKCIYRKDTTLQGIMNWETSVETQDEQPNEELQYVFNPQAPGSECDRCHPAKSKGPADEETAGTTGSLNIPDEEQVPPPPRLCPSSPPEADEESNIHQLQFLSDPWSTRNVMGINLQAEIQQQPQVQQNNNLFHTGQIQNPGIFSLPQGAQVPAVFLAQQIYTVAPSQAWATQPQGLATTGALQPLFASNPPLSHCLVPFTASTYQFVPQPQWQISSASASNDMRFLAGTMSPTQLANPSVTGQARVQNQIPVMEPSSSDSYNLPNPNSERVQGSVHFGPTVTTLIPELASAVAEIQKLLSDSSARDANCNTVPRDHRGPSRGGELVTPSSISADRTSVGVDQSENEISLLANVQKFLSVVESQSGSHSGICDVSLAYRTNERLYEFYRLPIYKYPYTTYDRLIAQAESSRGNLSEVHRYLVHCQGKCKACFFHHKKNGCRSCTKVGGLGCPHCHYCSPDRKKSHDANERNRYKVLGNLGNLTAEAVINGLLKTIVMDEDQILFAAVAQCYQGRFFLANLFRVSVDVVNKSLSV